MVGLERLFAKAGHYTFVSSTCQKVLAVNCQASPLVNWIRCSSTRATVCRVNRLQYLRQYPTTVVNPDGSTYTIRYHEPRQIIKLPVDLSTLSEPERKRHLERRKPKTKINLADELEEDIGFDSSKYLKLVKKK